jgi:peptidoglycan/LPS O-acetylase OafA/YrhL
VLVKHLDHQKFTLLIVLWFVGTIAVPFIHTFTEFDYNPLMFVFTDWAGYYLLGVYLVSIKPRRLTPYLMLFLGLLAAIVGDWYVTGVYGAGKTGYFHGYLSFNMILASAALFILLVNIPKAQIEKGKGNNAALRLMHWIGKNTLPFYLLHIIVLEVLQIGLLGFRYPYTGIVLIDAIGLFLSAFTLSAAIIYVVKKIPLACKLIG